MTKPLALVFYERLLPGTQLVNRLQDLGYRVQTVQPAATLVTVAAQEKPLVVFADLQAARENVCEAIAKLKQNPATQHLPVVAFADEKREDLQEAARAVGAIAAADPLVVSHLAQLLDQALQLD
jgi:CheY-like chemotaxis protein